MYLSEWTNNFMCLFARLNQCSQCSLPFTTDSDINNQGKQCLTKEVQERVKCKFIMFNDESILGILSHFALKTVADVLQSLLCQLDHF